MAPASSWERCMQLALNLFSPLLLSLVLKILMVCWSINLCWYASLNYSLSTWSVSEMIVFWRSSCVSYSESTTPLWLFSLCNYLPSRSFESACCKVWRYLRRMIARMFLSSFWLTVLLYYFQCSKKLWRNLFTVFDKHYKALFFFTWNSLVDSSLMSSVSWWIAGSTLSVQVSYISVIFWHSLSSLNCWKQAANSLF